MADVTDKDEKMHNDNITLQVKNGEIFQRMTELASENKSIKERYRNSQAAFDKAEIATS